MITIKHLNIFITVAETHNMSLAAKMLYVSQPTISQTISEMEKFYNVKLFERYPKELFLTNAGAVLLEYACHVVKSFDHLNQIMLESGTARSLRIGATLTVGSCIICQILDEMRIANPKVELSVQIDNTKAIETKLLQNELDVAIVEGNIHREEIIAQPVIKDCLVLVCSQNHPFAQREFVSKEELAAENFILREQGSGTRELFVNFMSMHQLPLNIKWEANSSTAIKQAVIHNYGLAVISARLIREELESGQLCIVNVKDCMWKRFFYLCYHKNKSLTEQLSSFNDISKSYSIYGIPCPIEKLEEPALSALPTQTHD